jgi:cyclopropane-fatty-acyl-phospholipid synthase
MIEKAKKPIKFPFYWSIFINQIRKNWEIGTLEIELPNGETSIINGKINNDIIQSAHLKINNYRAFRRILFSGDIGFFEGYRNNDWQTRDLYALLQTISLNLDGIEKFQNNAPLKNTLHLLLHWLRPNSKKGSRKNIYAHYDIGNEFFEKWLDKSMTYSAGIFDNSEDLENAQIRKYEEIAKSVDLKAGDSILEIGCGWGGFAIYAAHNIGAKVTCVTISQAQHDYTQALIKERGLEDKIELKLMDYRDIDGQFDAIVSIEMFEAVGEAYWSIYFTKLQSLLKPNGKVGLQIITIRDDLFDDYRNNTDFIQNYIFPGGMLPSIAKLHEIAEANDFNAHIRRVFGIDYYKTLIEWGNRFEKAWNDGKIIGFDLNFKRLWDFYLAYCAAGFKSKRTDVVHLVLSK